MVVLRDAVRVPGLLRLSRLPLGVAFALASEPASALSIVAAAAATDVLDGWWARKFHQATATGAALDPLMDKTFALFVVGTLVVARSLSPLDAVLLSARELVELPLVPYVIARGAAPQKSNAAGKITTVLQFGAIFLVLVGSPHRRLAIAATACAGLVAGATYWARAIKQRSGATARRTRAPSRRVARAARPADRAT